jgi:diguanylate cyclase (GGDEF)-like protein
MIGFSGQHTPAFALYAVGEERHIRKDLFIALDFEDIHRLIRCLEVKKRLSLTRSVLFGMPPSWYLRWYAFPDLETLRRKAGIEFVPVEIRELVERVKTADPARAQAVANEWLQTATETVGPSTEDIVKGLNAGADDYITNPVEPAELQARLSTGNRIIELENRNRRLQQKLEKMAREDSLTGFLNKRHIHERLEEELSRGLRDQMPVGAVLLDIDRFKHINDTHGHHIGDQVLLEIATRIRHSIRRHDQVGRYGGDEILVLLWNANSDSLRAISQRLCSCVSSQPIATDAGPLEVSVSVGGASSQDHWNISAKSLIKLSDQALYNAKNSGRNRAEIIESDKKELTNVQ